MFCNCCVVGFPRFQHSLWLGKFVSDMTGCQAGKNFDELLTENSTSESFQLLGMPKGILLEWVLLMVQKSHSQPPFGCIKKPVLNDGSSTTNLPQLVEFSPDF